MPQYPGQKFDATLVTTSNAMNATSRSMLVELQTNNTDGKLFVGTYARVDVQTADCPALRAKSRVQRAQVLPAHFAKRQAR